MAAKRQSKRQPKRQPKLQLTTFQRRLVLLMAVTSLFAWWLLEFAQPRCANTCNADFYKVLLCTIGLAILMLVFLVVMFGGSKKQGN